VKPSQLSDHHLLPGEVRLLAIRLPESRLTHDVEGHGAPIRDVHVGREPSIEEEA